jgi:hypothetical protein
MCAANDVALRVDLGSIHGRPAAKQSFVNIYSLVLQSEVPGKLGNDLLWPVYGRLILLDTTGGCGDEAIILSADEREPILCHGRAGEGPT